MISGYDVSFPVGCPAEQCEGIVRVALAIWENAVLEDSATGEVIESPGVGLNDLPPELFIFRDAQARDSWQAKGAVPENENSMLHLLAGSDSVTVVVDNPEDALMQKMLSAFRERLYDIFMLRERAA